MKLRTKILSTLLVALIPLATVISCGSPRKEEHYIKHAYLFSPSIQNSKDKKRMFLPSLERDDIKNLPRSLNSNHGSPMISGGFGEERLYYSKNNQKVIHTGIDSLVNANTKLVAPADGEIINSVWMLNPAKPFANGAGGLLTMRSKIKDIDIPDSYKEVVYLKYIVHKPAKSDKSKATDKTYIYASPKIQFIRNGILTLPTNNKPIFVTKDHNIKIIPATKNEYDSFISNYTPKSSREPTRKQLEDSSKYIYFGFMHLSKKSVNLWGQTKVKKIGSLNTEYSVEINEQHKWKKINKGDTIGYVGQMNENGGWATHVHIETFIPNMIPNSKPGLKRVYSKSRNPLGGLKATGTIASIQYPSFKKKYVSWDNYAIANGLIDPNNIFNLYDENTEKITITI